MFFGLCFFWVQLVRPDKLVQLDQNWSNWFNSNWSNYERVERVGRWVCERGIEMDGRRELRDMGFEG